LATDYGHARLTEANGVLARARLQHAFGESDAEEIARKGLRVLRSAMNWLEDTEDFEAAHFKLDEAGRWVRETFGCTLKWDPEKGYQQMCPVALAHTRIGMSYEARDIESLCSVCGLDPRLCRHVRGRTYDVPRIRVVGKCNVCGAKADCEHLEGDVYPVYCFHYITKVRKLDALSLVSRPAQPDARIEGMSVSVSDLRSQLGEGWIPGMPVTCNRCLQECTGVVEIPRRLEDLDSG
jgi:hypothetical protein